MFTGIFLGLLTALSTLMTFLKWPDWLKRQVCEHELIADILAGCGVWAILGIFSKTLGAVIGAVIAELILGTSLHFYVEAYHAGKVLGGPKKAKVKVARA